MHTVSSLVASQGRIYVVMCENLWPDRQQLVDGQEGEEDGQEGKDGGQEREGEDSDQ